MKKMLAAFAVLFACACTNPAAPEPRQSADAPALPPELTASELTTFGSEEAFLEYVREVRRVAKQNGVYWAGGAPVRFAQAAGGQVGVPDDEPSVCPDEEPDCLAKPSGTTITVTSSRIAPPANASITNNQKRGVDEGDIVKQVGRFLLVLQDGRLFSIDIRAGSGSDLVLVDRIDVYRNEKADTWYDEMLVHGDRIVVTGYSFGEEATELAMLRIDPLGRLRFDGTFYLSSNDYYSVSNYASRLVDDRLILYSPMSLTDINPYRPIDWPVLRRWTPGTPPKARAGERPLYQAAGIYRPLMPTLAPTVHSVSVCSLAGVADGSQLECRVTAVAAQAEGIFYVSPSHAYLWTFRGYYDFGDHDLPECGRDAYARRSETHRSVVYRIPLEGGAPSVLGARGGPWDQFSMETNGDDFRAFLGWPPNACQSWNNPIEVAYFRTSASAFANRLEEAPEEAYSVLPRLDAKWLTARFTDRHLVYGAVSEWRWRMPRSRMPAEWPPLAVVPLSRPAGVRLIDMPHGLVRLERAGDHAFVTGYSDPSALDLSFIRLDRTPRLASTVRARGRYESEGRSHAFNSLLDADGSGILGLPTTRRVDADERSWWRSIPSDVSFFEASATGQLEALGHLSSEVPILDSSEDEDGIAGYDCEASCVDWYGNARPIFTDGRIFGLTGSELVEGRLHRGRIEEVRRVLFLRPDPHEADKDDTKP